MYNVTNYDYTTTYTHQRYDDECLLWHQCRGCNDDDQFDDDLYDEDDNYENDNDEENDNDNENQNENDKEMIIAIGRSIEKVERDEEDNIVIITKTKKNEVMMTITTTIAMVGGQIH